jgi:hypothetical protein
MAPDRRRQVVLLALVIVMSAVIYRVWPRPAAPAPAASNTRGAARTPDGGGAAAAPDVHLEALEAERPKPGDGNRNLFRFRTPPAPPPRPAPPPVAAPPPKPSEPPAPTVPPIPLKFIGVMGKSGQSKKIAILTDGRGKPVTGGEGDTILGQYRIVRIGPESVEMSYLDGRGRQTIRLGTQ